MRSADEWPSLGLGETVGSVVGLRPLWGRLLLLGCSAWVALPCTPVPAGETHPSETHHSETRPSKTRPSETHHSEETAAR